MTTDDLLPRLSRLRPGVPVVLSRGGQFLRVVGVRDDGALLCVRVDPADVDPAGLVEWGDT